MSLSKRTISMKSEKKTSKDLGMSLTKNSGANTIKGDMHDDIFCVEQKDTSKDTWTFRYHELKKHTDFCTSYNWIPVFLVKFALGNGLSADVYAISESYVKEFLWKVPFVGQVSSGYHVATASNLKIDLLTTLNIFGSGNNIRRCTDKDTYYLMPESEFKRVKGAVRDQRRVV